MLQQVSATLWAIIIIVSRVSCAPIANDAKNQSLDNAYDYSKFDEVYDQRQNGSENYKVDVNGVVLVYAPPEALLATLPLLDQGLSEDVDYLEAYLDNLVNSENKPVNLPEVSPERSSSSTTTSLPPTPAGEKNSVPPKAGSESKGRKHVAKRRYRFPEFIRSLISRRRSQ